MSDDVVGDRVADERHKKHKMTGSQCLVGTIGNPVPGSHPCYKCADCGWVSWSEVDGECCGSPEAKGMKDD